MLDVDADLTAPPEIGTGLYRIAQEALANVARHAHAHRVHVSLRRMGDELELVIEDDGVGFVPSTRGRGVGLASMSERAETLRGKLHLRARPHGGTHLRVVVPLAAQAMERRALVVRTTEPPAGDTRTGETWAGETRGDDTRSDGAYSDGAYSDESYSDESARS